MRGIIIFVLVLIVFTGLCYAQAQFAVALGTVNLDYGFSVIQTADGGYAMAGYTYIPPTGGYDMLIAKFDTMGNCEWARTIGRPAYYNYGYSLIQTADNGYIISGATDGYGAGYFDMLLVKFNSTGTFQWAKVLGGTGAEYGYSIINTSDGGYAVAGVTGSYGAGATDIFLVKFSSADVFQWATATGGTDEDLLSQGAPSVIQTADGGYAVNGYTQSFGMGWWDFIFVKFTAAGAVSWARTVGESPIGSPDWGYSVAQTTDGGYVLTGHTSNFGAGMGDLLLVKFNSAGTFQWANTVGEATSDAGLSVVSTPDGGCVATGFIGFSGPTSNDVWLLKFAAGGALTWTRVMPWTFADYGREVILTSDGGYAIGGMTSSFGAGDQDFLLVKYDNMGYTCTGKDTFPIVMNCSPTVTYPSLDMVNPSPTITDVSPVVTDITPTLTFICPVECSLEAIASNDGPYCEGDTIRLFGGPDAMSLYQWSGPDTFSSFSQNPTIPNATSSNAGTYTLIVMDSLGCYDTVTTDVTVNFLPFVYCMASGECVGDTIRLHGGGPGLIYDWTGPDGFSSSEMEPIIPNATLDNTGWYYLVGTDTTTGCSNLCSVYVEIVNCSCPQPLAWIECPLPCWSFSSCSLQSVVFGFIDTAGVGMDSLNFYFTTIVEHIDETVDTTHLFEPTPFIEYFTSADTLFANVWGNWNDGDSVVVSFDSMVCEPIETWGCKAIGEIESEVAYSVTPAQDGGFVVAGYTESFGVSMSDLFVIKFDSYASLEWAKTIGGTSFDCGWTHPTPVISTTDGGYAVAGNTQSFGAGATDVFFVKLGPAGSFEWARAIGGALDDVAYSIIQTADNGYIISGVTSSYGSGNTDLFLIKLSSAGVLEWAKSIGGPQYDEGWSVIRTLDGGYAVAGFTSSFGAGYFDIWLLKFDPTYSLEWSKTLGGSLNDDQGIALVQSDDAGYIIAGMTAVYGAGSWDCILAKFDSTGIFEWAKTIGGVGLDVAWSLTKTTTGEYAIAGGTQSFGAGSRDFLIVKMNDAAELLWALTIGDTAYDEARAIASSLTGNLIVAGGTASFGAGPQDFLIA
ncbi:hypothetical protein DRQ33_04980, partial [bacterium]